MELPGLEVAAELVLNLALCVDVSGVLQVLPQRLGRFDAKVLGRVIARLDRDVREEVLLDDAKADAGVLLDFLLQLLGEVLVGLVGHHGEGVDVEAVDALAFLIGFVVRVEGNAAYVTTAAHVVEGNPDPRLYFRSRPHSPVEARVVAQEGGDPNGLALLRVDARLPAGVRALPVAADGGADLVLAQAVTAVGFPASIGRLAVLPGAVVAWRNRNILFSGDVDEGNSEAV